MSLKTYCLALILVLTAASTHDLQARGHVIDLAPGVSPFEQEFAPIAKQLQVDIRQRIESLPKPIIGRFNDGSPCLTLQLAELLKTQFQPGVWYSSDLCYLHMSLLR